MLCIMLMLCLHCCSEATFLMLLSLVKAYSVTMQARDKLICLFLADICFLQINSRSPADHQQKTCLTTSQLLSTIAFLESPLILENLL